VYGQSIRGASKEFKDWVLKEGYMDDEVIDIEGGRIKFKHKSRIYPKELPVNTTISGSKKKKKNTVTIDQKQMVYYSEKYAKKQRKDQEVMIDPPKKYDKITSAGSAAYIDNIAFDKTTGEVVEGKALSLKLEKIEEDALYDGYYSIVTSELNMSDLEIRDVYRGLARIEDTCKVSKTEFETRPIYVWTNEHQKHARYRM